MADTNDAGVAAKIAEVTDQNIHSGAQEMDTSGKMEASSPRKRDRPHNEENESAGNAVKRVKGVAPIKEECVWFNMIP